jgi:hypothetical protein
MAAAKLGERGRARLLEAALPGSDLPLVHLGLSAPRQLLAPSILRNIP